MNVARADDAGFDRGDASVDVDIARSGDAGLDGADVPVAFRGTAIAMVTAGIMSLAFMGFAGLDKYH